jgi:hypothetical protein
MVYHVKQERHWCKASNGVQASDDELIDIWWPDILFNYLMINWILPELYMYIIDECADERHCASWTLVGLQKIKILKVFSLEHTKQQSN